MYSTIYIFKDLLDSTIGEISFLFMLGSIGTMSGCFVLGLLMDRFVRFGIADLKNKI